jgi:hypothetical protein
LTAGQSLPLPATGATPTFATARRQSCAPLLLALALVPVPLAPLSEAPSQGAAASESLRRSRSKAV